MTTYKPVNYCVVDGCTQTAIWYVKMDGMHHEFCPTCLAKTIVEKSNDIIKIIKLENCFTF